MTLSSKSTVASCTSTDCRKNCVVSSSVSLETCFALKTKKKKIGGVVNAASIADVCYSDFTKSCNNSTTTVCGPGGRCGKPNGANCTAGADCASNNCIGGFCCSTSVCPLSCNTCATGVCKSLCASAQGCNATIGNSCTSVTCSNAVAGWNNVTCERYSGSISPGLCQLDGTCTNLSSYQYCDRLPKMATYSCGSVGCRINSTCQLNSSPPSMVSQICFTDKMQHGCAANQRCSSGSATCKKILGK